MPTQKIITPEFRGVFVNLFRPKGFKNADGTEGTRNYTIQAAFPPSADLSALKEQAKTAAQEKWGDKIPKGMNSPFRENGELDNPKAGIDEDWVIVTFNAKEDAFTPKNNVVDANAQPILDETECYSGAWYRAQIQAYAYDQKGNKGVAFGLRNVQKLKDDAPIGSANMPASKAFEPVASGAASSGKGAGSLFD